MARPHVDFIQSQVLPWISGPWPVLAGCHLKLLSRDPEGGAASVVVRIPAGWGRTTPGWLDAALEFLVIEGALDVNGRRYDQDCYAWLPACYPLRGFRSEDGSVLLAFVPAEPAWHDGAPSQRELPAGTVEFLDAYDIAWDASGLDPHLEGLGMRRKVLRGSPQGPEATMLVACPPHVHPQGWRGPQEVQECSEEMFLLSGDYQSNLGQMVHGAYFWRPPGIAHGPYGTRGGNLALVRTAGSPLRRRRTVHEMPILRSPAYAPRLPKELEPFRHRPWRSQRY